MSRVRARTPLWSSDVHAAAADRRLRDVLGIGENSLDTICVVDGLPQPGENHDALQLLIAPGGQVATTVLACARMGLAASYAGTVGDDPAASAILEPLTRGGVDVTSVARITGAASRSAVILVDATSGERTVLGHRDERLALAPGRPGMPDESKIAAHRVLHLDAVDCEAAAWAARCARRAGVAVVLDADAITSGIEALLALVDFPIVSRAFAEEWGGSGSVRDGLEAISGPGTRLAVATLGPKGALALGPDGWLETQAFDVEARDTTGAGDAFHAGFIWGLLAGRNVTGVLRAAHAVAALNCTALGAQAGLPRADEVERFESDRRAPD